MACRVGVVLACFVLDSWNSSSCCVNSFSRKTASASGEGPRDPENGGPRGGTVSSDRLSV